MKIQVNHIVRDMTPEEEAEYFNMNAITEDEALTRYANSITGASDPDLISAAETLIEQRIKEGGE